MIDVAIVGGGPAGSAAAIVCARAGLSTVMFERQNNSEDGAPSHADEPEESLGPECVALLLRLGIDCAVTGAPYCGIATGSNVTLFLAAAAASGRHVRRSWLDGKLRMAASRSGAACRLGTEVVDVEPRTRDGFLLTTSAGSMVTRQLIDATGRRSWLARRWNLSRRRLSPPLIAWRDVIEGPVRPVPVASFEPDRDGWTFVAQVEPGRAVRTLLRTARDTSQAPGLRPSLREASVLGVFGWVVRQLAGSGWFIAGEAAAALDPGAGNGVAFALRSGMAAGRSALACATETTAAPVIAARYDDALLAEFEAGASELGRRYRQLGVSVLRGHAAAHP